jgi:hypothetical protein
MRREEEAIRAICDGLGVGDVFSFTDEFNLSRLPTLRALWSLLGQRVMIPTLEQPTQRSGFGAVTDHTGEAVVLFRRHQLCHEIAQVRAAAPEQHPTSAVRVAWDNVSTHEDGVVDDFVRPAARCLAPTSWLSDCPWLNPIEMRWRHFRRAVTHSDLAGSMADLVVASGDLFARQDQHPHRILLGIGSRAIWMHLDECTHYRG